MSKGNTDSIVIRFNQRFPRCGFISASANSSQKVNTMDNFIGKHLLVDCYGCVQEEITSSKALISVMNQAAKNLGLSLIHI